MLSYINSRKCFPHPLAPITGLEVRESNKMAELEAHVLVPGKIYTWILTPKGIVFKGQY